MISLARYSALLAARDLRFSFAASIVGRLPIGIAGLAILLLVQGQTGSFARGGAATGCYVAGLATLAPALGRLIDRYGPRFILLGCAILFPAALAALVASVTLGAHAWMTLALASVAGGAFPPITVCMRTYLKQRLGNDASLGTAYSLESVLIEMVFIVGPMLVASFVAVASPTAAVLFAALCGFVGTLLFLRSPALRAWRTEARSASGLLGPLAEPGFVPLIGVILCYSMAFGLMEIGLAAYATELDAPALTGVLLGLMSAGSAFGALAYGSRTWRGSLAQQFATTLALMSFGLAVLALRWQPWLFALLSVAAGIMMAPPLIIQSMLVAKTARPEHATEAFTWSASALLSGVGIGLAAGGGLLEVMPSSVALAAGAASALLAAIGVSIALRR